jgi:hypothetical protein
MKFAMDFNRLSAGGVGFFAGSWKPARFIEAIESIWKRQTAYNNQPRMTPRQTLYK